LFFLTKKYDKRYGYGECLRQYPKEAENYAEASLDFGMMQNRAVTFGNLWKKRTSFALVPLEEGQFKVWTWGRFACLEDSVNKMTPNAGQGETQRSKAQRLLPTRLPAIGGTKGDRPTYDQIRRSLGGFQARLDQRISGILKISNDLTRVHTLKSVVERIMVQYVMPQMGDYLVDLLSDIYMGAELVEFLPPPHRCDNAL